MDEQLQARRLLELDLREAVEKDQLELHYQPIFDVAENRVRGVEALVRWRHPERGLVAPLGVHPARRGDRLHHADRGLGPRTRVPGCRDMAPRHHRRRQRIRGAVPGRPRPEGGRGPLRYRACGRPPRSRDHRERAAVQQRTHAGRAQRTPCARHQDIDGRFRDRLLVAQLPPQLPVRQGQDRSEFHARCLRDGGGERDRSHGDRPMPKPRHADDGRRRRKTRSSWRSCERSGATRHKAST